MEFYGMGSIFEGDYSAKLYMRPGNGKTVLQKNFRNFGSCIQWAVFELNKHGKNGTENWLTLVVTNEKGRDIRYSSYGSLIKDIWETLTDVPMDPETENIEEDWFIFPAGTNRETIWHWFDEQYEDGVAALMGA